MATITVDSPSSVSVLSDSRAVPDVDEAYGELTSDVPEVWTWGAQVQRQITPFPLSLMDTISYARGVVSSIKDDSLGTVFAFPYHPIVKGTETSSEVTLTVPHNPADYRHEGEVSSTTQAALELVAPVFSHPSRYEDHSPVSVFVSSSPTAVQQGGRMVSSIDAKVVMGKINAEKVAGWVFARTE